MTPIDELEKFGSDALSLASPLWRTVCKVFLRMLVQSLRYLERKIDER